MVSVHARLRTSRTRSLNRLCVDDGREGEEGNEEAGDFGGRKEEMDAVRLGKEGTLVKRSVVMPGKEPSSD